MNANIDFEQLVNAVGDAVVVSDVKGRVTLWNPAAEQLFGLASCREGLIWEIVREMLLSWEMMKRRLQEGVRFFRFLRAREA
jgi:PAS domain S-box-containing protein